MAHIGLLLRWLLPWLAVASLGVAATAAPAQGAGLQRESAVKAAFLFKFPAFIDWPADRLQRADEPLAIGVLGDDAVAVDLAQLVAGRTVDGRRVVVRRVTQGDLPGANLHVLFIGATTPERLREVAAASTGPVLLVTDQDRGLEAGAALNFVLDRGRVRFAAAPQQAESRGLRLSARLLAVAAHVEGRER